MVTANIINGKVDDTSKDDNISSVKNKKDFKKASTLDVNDFLQLLVAQMQYQDPLEPTDNTQYIAQMATFTQVEATTQMGQKVGQQMASALVGKMVIMETDQNSDGMVAGKVDYWETINNTVYLGIDGKLYDIADLDTVMDEDYFKNFEEQLNKLHSTQGTETTDDKTDEK